MLARCTLTLLVLIAAAISPAGRVLAQDEIRSSNGPPTYQDRLIDDGGLRIDIWDDYAPIGNEDGWPRSIRLDGLYAYQKRAGVTTTQGGAGVGAFFATPQYGSFSFEGLFTNGEDTSIATLWQRDMPFDGGWRANNGLGMLNSPAIDLVRFQPRIFLPTTPMLGALTEWRSPTGIQAIAGVGEPGVYYGSYIPEFRRLGGQVTTFGAQRAADRNITVGFQYVGGNEVTSVFQNAPDPRPFNSRSALFAGSWQDVDSRYQLNILESQNSETQPNQGAWLDALVRAGRYVHTYGLFHLDPSLLWGNQIVPNDSRGAYYRVYYGSPRWQWDAGVDYVVRVSDHTDSAVTFTSGSLRYQWRRDLSFGGGGSLRSSDSTAYQAFAYVEHVERVMTGRVQLNQLDDSSREETNLTFDQTWNTPAGTRLNTSAMVGSYRSAFGESYHQTGLSAFGGGDIARNLSLDLNVQWTKLYGDTNPSTTTGSLALTWQIEPEIRLIATAYRSQARAYFPLVIASPLDPVLPDTRTRIDDTGAFLILRYETRAGSLSAPLGGTPGVGAGRIAGIVFLDGNESGRADAGELGAANVTVILNGRWSVRTDAQGRFEFPSVVSGQHTITVMSDNLPLPWQLVNDGRVQFDVPVRGTVNVDIPAQRMR